MNITAITMAGKAGIDEDLWNVPQFSSYQMSVSTTVWSASGQKRTQKVQPVRHDV